MQFVERWWALPETRELIELHPFQRDLIEEWCDPGVKVSATVIGAGAGKTSLLGAASTAHLMMTDEAAIPVIADTVSQAWETTLGKVARFVELHPELKRRTTVLEGQGSRQGCYHPYRGGRAWAVADKPSRLYGLNPSWAVLEEMGVASIGTFAAAHEPARQAGRGSPDRHRAPVVHRREHALASAAVGRCWRAA